VGGKQGCQVSTHWFQWIYLTVCAGRMMYVNTKPIHVISDNYAINMIYINYNIIIHNRNSFMHSVTQNDNPIGSMYAIYGNIYHQYTPNVSIYTIHGSYGNMQFIQICNTQTHTPAGRQPEETSQKLGAVFWSKGVNPMPLLTYPSYGHMGMGQNPGT